MAEIDDWKGRLGAQWALRTEKVERLLGPFGFAAMERLGDVGGKRVLDLGCGGGATTFALARRGAVVLGVDVSPDLIALAGQRRAVESGPARAAGFLLADAAEAAYAEPMEALFSQFGAMFFADPPAAYAHLRRQMAPGARLAIACWRTPRENEWASLPLAAVKPLLPPAPPANRRAPGPFAWSEPEETFAPMLKAAGWRKVSWTAEDRMIDMNEDGGEDPAEAATRFALEIGPVASRLRDQPESLRKKAEAALRDAMEARVEAGRIELRAAGWIVTARA